MRSFLSSMAATVGATVLALAFAPLVGAQTSLADWHARFDAAGADAGALGALSEELLSKVAADERGLLRETPALWNLFQWAELCGRGEFDERRRWARALEEGGSVLRLSGTVDPAAGRPLGGILEEPMRAALVRDARFLEEFFSLLSPMDDATSVLGVVRRLESGVPDWRKDYLSLGLAVAVVLEMQRAPDWWPHAQVTEELLPRTLEDPVEAFKSWRALDAGKRSLLDLKRADASDLRFLVASLLDREQREWAVAQQRVPLHKIPELYSRINYDTPRVERGEYVWPGADYRLQTILARGGICVDQAFFGSEIAKALGVPAIVFSGQGADARHAWFGYLAGQSGWKLDVGRGADARLVAGVGLDPQTWTRLTEHELAFLAERFRSQTRYRDARRLHGIAAALHARGRIEEAARFARRSVQIERRLEPGWALLLECAAARGAREEAAVAAEATQAFGRHPDLELRFAARLMDAWTRLGQHSLVEAEELRMLRRNQTERPDISTALARQMLERARVREKRERGQRTYERILMIFGEKGGIGLFDAVVAPQFQTHLDAGDLKTAARTAELARRHLRPQKGSQLDEEITSLEGPGRR